MKKLYIIGVLVILINVQKLKAQLPLNNPNFSTITFDDFNSWGTSSSNWCTEYGCYSSTNSGLEYNDPTVGNNILFQSSGSTTYVTLKAEHLTTPVVYNGKSYNYKGAVLFSAIGTFKYGYFEIKARLPQFVNGSWPAFWLQSSDCSSNYYNEIDIMENGGYTSGMGHLVAFNMWREDPSVPCDTTLQSPFSGTGLTNSGVPESADLTDWHRYGVFWEPNKVTYFFDDAIIAQVTDASYIPQHPMYTIINHAIDNWVNPGGFFPNPSPLPAYFDIDYYKLSQLNTDCSVNYAVCSFNNSTFDYRVKKSISIAGGSCSSTINLTDNASFFATDYILLDVGTTINANSSGAFTAYTTNCPQ